MRCVCEGGRNEDEVCVKVAGLSVRVCEGDRNERDVRVVCAQPRNPQ